MAKKEIKKQTIEEILAVQRREEEAAGTDHHQYPLWDNLRKIRAEEKRAQQCIAQGLRKAGCPVI